MTVTAPTAPAATPSVFTKLITTPPGLPWDQARVARLEAARAAPVAIESLTVRLKRLAPWAKGKSGQYLAFYARANALGGGFRASKTIEGRTLSVDFKSKAQSAAETKVLAILAGVGGAAALLSVTAAIAVGAVRHSADKALDDLEQRSARELRQAQVISDMKRQNLALREVEDLGTPLSEVLAELGWASRMHRTDVPVEAFHWRPVGFGVEVRGDEQPFTGAGAQRAARPLRPGVWLWVKVRGPGRPAASGPGSPG